MSGHRDIADLLAIMARLRDPQGGCPWDLEQDFSSIAPYTVEEAYEVADGMCVCTLSRTRQFVLYFFFFKQKTAYEVKW